MAEQTSRLADEGVETADRAPELIAAGVGLALEALAVEVTTAFERSGIPSILLKGPRSSAGCTRRPRIATRSTSTSWSLRPTSHAQRRHSPSSGSSRSSRGATTSTPAVGCDRGTRSRSTSIAAWSVSASTTRHAWDVLSGVTEQLEVRGATFSVLQPHGRALHLALHAAQETPDKEKALRDLGRGLELLELEVWRQARVLAVRTRRTPRPRSGASSPARGDAVARELQLPKRVTTEIALRSGRRARPVARDEPPPRNGRHRDPREIRGVESVPVTGRDAGVEAPRPARSPRVGRGIRVARPVARRAPRSGTQGRPYAPEA